ncbi:MAG TPA: methyltransferase domain-containing protein [Nitrolancea sp.]
MLDSISTTDVNDHYVAEHLVENFERILQSWGFENGLLEPHTLAPIDQFHIGGEAATLALANLAGIDATSRILDVGGGYGGPARTLAATYGCSIVVLDLTAAYCRLGEMLTERCGLSDRVSFRHGNALAMDLADASFDFVWTQHSSMNIADKSQLYTEIYRVLRPGGRLALYEIFAGNQTPIHYPVPWAHDASISFLSSPEEIHMLLTDIGFRTVQWEDLTDIVVDAQGRAPAPKLQLVLGEDFVERGRNMMRNLAKHRTSLVRAVFERP